MGRTPETLVDALARIVFGGVALTSQALDHIAQRRDLTFTQWWAIAIVGKDDTGLRVGNVARRINASLQATSHLLRRLEDRGLLSLARDEQDRRARKRMTDEHVEGNAIGGLLMGLFGQEMTDAPGCCDSCGSVHQLGELLVYPGMGDVARCPRDRARPRSRLLGCSSRLTPARRPIATAPPGWADR